MTINHGSFSEGFETESGTYFAYTNYPLSVSATSKVSKEDVLEKFCQLLSDKLKKISETVSAYSYLSSEE
jgi:hypothetical protein